MNQTNLNFTSLNGVLPFKFNNKKISIRDLSLIFQSNIHPAGVYGIWQVIENDDYFLDKIDLYPSEMEELGTLKSRKRTEWLSSRYLLHKLSEREIRGACLKDKYGKPYLENSRYFISISHTADLTAVIASPNLVGIDIQIIVPKIIKIAPKFINTNEQAFIPIEGDILYLHTIWGAKESMYKAYGKKELDFKNDMEVLPFEFDAEGFFFQGSLKKDDVVQNFTLFCRQFDQFILVYAIKT